MIWIYNLPTSPPRNGARSRSWTWCPATGCPKWSPLRSLHPGRGRVHRALCADGKDHLLHGDVLDELRSGVVSDGDELPVLLALSDNGPQMTSKSTKVFLASTRIATHFGRPGTPNDEAWIESLLGHVKTEHPHLEKIRDPRELEAELDRIRPVLQHDQASPGRRLRHARRTNTPVGAPPSAPPAAPGRNAPTRPGLPLAANYDRITHERRSWLRCTPQLWCIYSEPCK
jgi:hypothetical protein